MNETKETLILCIGGLIGSILMTIHMMGFIKLETVTLLGFPTLLLVGTTHYILNKEN